MKLPTGEGFSKLIFSPLTSISVIEVLITPAASQQHYQGLICIHLCQVVVLCVVFAIFIQLSHFVGVFNFSVFLCKNQLSA